MVNCNWTTPLRAHLRITRRQELVKNAQHSLWEEIHIEYRPYIKNIHTYMMGTSSQNDEEGESATFHSNADTDSVKDMSNEFVMPRGCKFSDRNDIFNTYVDIMWSRCTGRPFDCEGEEEHANNIVEECVGLRRSFFNDAIPQPWWKGLEPENGDDSTDPISINYEQVKYYCELWKRLCGPFNIVSCVQGIPTGTTFSPRANKIYGC